MFFGFEIRSFFVFLVLWKMIGKKTALQSKSGRKPVELSRKIDFFNAKKIVAKNNSKAVQKRSKINFAKVH